MQACVSLQLLRHLSGVYMKRATRVGGLAMLMLLFLVTSLLIARGDAAAGAKIVGGTNATIEDIPYQASLQVDGNHTCGAVLVGAAVALTAAHCLDDVTDVADVTLRVGTDRLEEGGVVVPVAAAVIHPSYEYWTLDYDVAVLTLAGDVTVPGTVAPVDEDYYPLPGDPVVVSGWGTLQNSDAAFSETLQAVTLPVVRSSKCNDGYGGDVSERMLCVGEAWKGACDGDAGGPATVTVGSEVLLLGVVSWNYGCDLSGYPTVVTSVASVRGWIRDTAGV